MANKVAAILIILVIFILILLFEAPTNLIQNNPGAPTECIAQPRFICSDTSYINSGGVGNITFKFGQNTNETVYNVNLFIGSEGSALSTTGVVGIPQGMTDGGNSVIAANVVSIGTLEPGQVVAVSYINDKAGGIPENPVTGTPFYGYIWISYCTVSSQCTMPTNWAKVATLAIRSTS